MPGTTFASRVQFILNNVPLSLAPAGPLRRDYNWLWPEAAARPARHLWHETEIWLTPAELVAAGLNETLPANAPLQIWQAGNCLFSGKATLHELERHAFYDAPEAPARLRLTPEAEGEAGTDIADDPDFAEWPEMEVFNHTYTIESVTQAWQGQLPYAYPLIDYGLLGSHTQGSALALRDWLPALRPAALILLALRKAGISCTAPELTTGAAGRLVVPYYGNTLLHSGNWLRDHALHTARQTLQSIGGATAVDWQVKEAGAALSGGQNSYTAPEGLRLNLSLQATGTGLMAMRLMKNGTLHQQWSATPGGVVQAEAEVWLNAGDTLEWMAVGPGLLIDAYCEWTPGTTIENGSTLRPRDWLPDKTPMDWLRLLCTLHNMRISFSDDSKEMKIHTFDKMMDSAGVVPLSISTHIPAATVFRFVPPAADQMPRFILSEYSASLQPRLSRAQPWLQIWPAAQREKGTHPQPAPVDLGICLCPMRRTMSNRLPLPFIDLARLDNGDFYLSPQGMPPTMLHDAGMQLLSTLSSGAISSLEFGGTRTVMPYAYSTLPAGILLEGPHNTGGSLALQSGAPDDTGRPYAARYYTRYMDMLSRAMTITLPVWQAEQLARAAKERGGLLPIYWEGLQGSARLCRLSGLDYAGEELAAVAQVLVIPD